MPPSAGDQGTSRLAGPLLRRWPAQLPPPRSEGSLYRVILERLNRQLSAVENESPTAICFSGQQSPTNLSSTNRPPGRSSPKEPEASWTSGNTCGARLMAPIDAIWPRYFVPVLWQSSFHALKHENIARQIDLTHLKKLVQRLVKLEGRHPVCCMLIMFRDVRVAKEPALDNCLGSECWGQGDNDGAMRMACANSSVSLAVRSDLI